jgi:two-component system, LytTR family, sensor kinase
MQQNINLRKVGTNLVFWVVYFLYVWLPDGSIKDKYWEYFILACCLTPIAMAATYFTIGVTIERFLLKKQMVYFWLSLASSLVVFGILRRVALFTIIYPMLFPELLTEHLLYLPRITLGAVQVHLIAAVGAIIYLIDKWKEQKHIAEVLEKEKLAAELALLTSQVQPHFIFNTLNNIYMLSMKGSTQTSDMVYRLSSLLSYMLYDSKQEHIQLEKEVDYIKNYINLEKIRYGDRLDIQLNVYKNLKGVSIPPLLFLPLVENAFKHGASNAVKDTWIHIDISAKKNILTFKVENSIADEKKEKNSFGNGLGLVNLRKRLEILFPNKFDMKTMVEDNTFLAVVKIELDDLITEGGKKNQKAKATQA